MPSDRLMRVVTTPIAIVIVIVIATAAWFPARQAWAQGDADDEEQSACRQQFDPATVSVTALPIQPSMDLSLDTRALTLIEGKSANQRVLGRTTARLRNTTRFQTRAHKLPSGRACLKPTLAVTVTFEPMVIFVGSEYAHGSCEYLKILAHEQSHVDVYAAHLSELVAPLQQDLRDYFAAANLVTAVPAEKRRMLQAGIQDTIRARLRQMAEGLHARQRAVDSAEELKRLSDLHKSCAAQRAAPPVAR